MECDTLSERTEELSPRCHICGSARIGLFMTAADNGHLRRSDVELPVYRCRQCDAFFLNPPPSPELGRQYFADAYARDGSRNLYYNDEFKDHTSRVRLELLSHYVRRGHRLLDVGCGKGRFVHTARQAGWDAWGVELDSGACDHARTALQLGTVFNGSLDHPALPGKFDVITLWDVIEHVSDPVGILRQVAGKLEDGGVVAVRTANIRSWTFDRQRSRWWAFGVDHRFYFSPASLGAAMNAAGLSVRDVVNGELAERPDKSPSRDISDTRITDGLRSLSQAPSKLLKVGRFGKALVTRMSGRRRYGAHYQTSIMTMIAVKAPA